MKRIKLLAALLYMLIGTSASVFAQSNSDEGNGESEETVVEEPFVVVEDMPVFQGSTGGFIAKNLTYPKYAAKHGIQGKVYVRFLITKTGEVERVSVVRGVHESLDNEAMRVIRMMPAWKPGRQRGKAVDVWFTIPINFGLN